MDIQPRKFISRVRCRKLFGRLDYDIDFAHDGSFGPTFIYGDNGTGKTTILRLLYSLLSVNISEGNRTYIAKIPFENFEVTFEDNSKLSVDRKQASTGSYYIGYVDSSSNLYAVPVTADDDLVVKREQNPEIHVYEDIISKLPFKLVYISHDREIKSTDNRIVESHESSTIEKALRAGDYAESAIRRVVRRQSAERKFALDHIAGAVLEDTRRKLIERANVAQENINSIYLTIA